MKGKLWVAGLVLLAVLNGNGVADKGKLSGYMFGDYYYVAAAASDSREGENALQFRRMYLTYDKGIDDGLSTRLRLEANDAGYGSGAKMVPFVKHAYLKWSKYLGSADLYLGLSGTPTWALAESVWGYRSIEKTVLDLNKIGSSADLGVALKGKAGRLSYFTMLGNGPGQKSEDDNGKKVYASVSMAPGEGLVVEGYADYNVRSQEREDRTETTLKIFAGYRGDGFNGGVEMFSRTNANALEDSITVEGQKIRKDQTIVGGSLFGSYPVVERAKAFVRLDLVRTEELIEKKEDERGNALTEVVKKRDMLLIAGLDYSPRTNMHWMPNLYVVMPDGGDPTVQGRMTFFFKF